MAAHNERRQFASKLARAVVCPAGANIAHTPVSLRSTVAPVRNPATPPYDVKDKGDAKRNRELTQGCGPGMPGPYGLLFPATGVRGNTDSKVEEGAGALRTKSNTAFV